MSILQSIFGGGQQQQPAPAAPQTPNTPDGAAANPTIPNATNSPIQQEAGGQQAASPLDAYKDIWDNMTVQQQTDNSGNVLSFDRTKLSEVANKMDFASSLKPEHLQAISQGGDAAIQSLVDVLNTVSRNAYLNSTETTAHLINSALGKTKQDITASIPDYIKKANVSQNLRAENPMFSNPAVAPVLQALENQLTAKYPNASANEITQHAKEYLQQFAGAVAPQQQNQQPAIPKDQDFSGWM